MTTDVHGECDDKFASVREAFEASLASGADIGASFCATVEGETVIDIWGGYKDREKTAAWEEDTIVNVYSSTKTMASLVMLMLADRGEIDFYEKVSKYWPEFAQNGKESVEVRHIMSHSAGLSGLDEPVTEAQLYDRDYIASLLAAQAPWWTPGSQSGYHALTQGQLQGEIVQRVTGKTLGQFFADEVAGPMEADFFIGVPPEKDGQVITIIPDPGASAALSAGQEGSIAARTFASPAVDATWAGHEAWRRAEIPAANGHGNARSIAEIHTILANGGAARGKRYLSEAGVKTIFDVQTEGDDLVLQTPVTFGMGFGLNSEAMPLSPNPNTCFWGGWGGSLVVIDTDAHLSGAYVMNQMAGGLIGDVRGATLWGGFVAAALG
jgi:CubicO group peptidase (beta-lactamase class C family)